MAGPAAPARTRGYGRLPALIHNGVAYSEAENEGILPV